LQVELLELTVAVLRSQTAVWYTFIACLSIKDSDQGQLSSYFLLSVHTPHRKQSNNESDGLGKKNTRANRAQALADAVFRNGCKILNSFEKKRNSFQQLFLNAK
jgi:hypothetical protein